MIKINTIQYNYLAVHYRLPDDPLYQGRKKVIQGCWRGFRDRQKAQAWLDHRATRTARSPQGKAIYTGMDHVYLVIRTTKNESLKAALEAFLEYVRLCQSHTSN